MVPKHESVWKNQHPSSWPHHVRYGAKHISVTSMRQRLLRNPGALSAVKGLCMEFNTGSNPMQCNVPVVCQWLIIVTGQEVQCSK